MEVTPALRGVEIALVPEEAAHRALEAAPRHALLDNGGEKAAVPTASVALVASPVALYALFEVDAEPPLRVGSSDGGPVFEDECVEIFVGRPEDPATYREIVVNPAGARYGAEIRNPDDSRETWKLRPGSLPEGLTVAVRGEPAGAPPGAWSRWSCRISVPWRALSVGGRAPAPDALWRLNAFRIARGASTRFQALSPTLRSAPPDFHIPSRFAKAVFRL